ncbi:alginate O-acetyltransferase, partial [Pseudomonas aeruginosa]
MNPMTRRHTWTRLAGALSIGVAADAAPAGGGGLD